jgi:hypothetical protein
MILEPTSLALLFLVTFLHVFFAAFQNQNLIYRKWKWIPPGSYCLTAAKIVETSAIAVTANVSYLTGNWESLLWIGLVMGTAGWIGSFASMYTHRNSV